LLWQYTIEADMKAAFFDSPGTALQIQEVMQPLPADDEVIVTVSHCGICSSDLHMTDGKGAYTAEKGTILGHEIAGTVTALGAAVKGIEKGDHVAVIPVAGCEVCAHCLQGEFKKCNSFEWREGGYAEHIVTKAQYCFRLADNIPLSDGALVEPMAVALRGARHAELKQGQHVLILGAGPIGLSSIYWAKHFGCEVSVMASSTRRQALAMSMGANQFVVNKGQGFEAILHQLGGVPDVVIECTGVPGMINFAVDIIKPHSTVVIPGWCTQQDTFLPMTAMNKELRLQFTALYNSSDFQYVVDTMANDKQANYRNMITGTVALNELPDTFESLRQAGEHVKVMVRPDT